MNVKIKANIACIGFLDPIIKKEKNTERNDKKNVAPVWWNRAVLVGWLRQQHSSRKACEIWTNLAAG